MNTDGKRYGAERQNHKAELNRERTRTTRKGEREWFQRTRERSFSKRPDGQKKLGATICNYLQLLATGGKECRNIRKRTGRLNRATSSRIRGMTNFNRERLSAAEPQPNVGQTAKLCL